jgi:asparagine synthase (glutamine-hydrolysing)
MTAIAGYWSFGAVRRLAGRCESMLAALSDYGPDARDVRTIDHLAFGRNLYRLLPEDAHDRQPLTGGGGRFLLVADVRLDNRDELRSALGLGPGEADGLADSTILLHALERWSESALHRIVGDFAFAFFDRTESRLMLARDAIGQRPLFWHRGNGFFAFASMPRGLHALDGIARAPDRDTVVDFAGHLGWRGPRSFHAEVQRVEPGHLVIVSPEGERGRRYWNPAPPALRLRRFDDYVDAYREILDRAVASRLRGADAGVASHLSGGWDSGAVAATAARLMAVSGGRLAAFTSVPKPAFAAEQPWRNRFSDEGPRAAAVAALHPNIDHVPIVNSSGSPIADLDDYVRVFGRPLYNLCNHVWLAPIRDAARARGARILLTGEIGNWTISAGPHALLADYLRQGRLVGWAREAGAMLATRKARLRNIAASSFGPWIPDVLWRHARKLAPGSELAVVTPLHPDLLDQLERRQEAERRGPAYRPGDQKAATRQALQEMDFGQYRKGVLAGWGLDKRDPTADTRLIDFRLSLPLELLLRNGQRRPLARAALSDRLPPAVLDAPGKGYQAADWSEGMGKDIANIEALIERIAAHPMTAAIFDVERLRTLVRNWPAGGWSRPETIARYRMGLLTALSAGHFLLMESS